MPRITKETHPYTYAYNSCVDALNRFEDELERLLDMRDKAWVAADALYGGSHGQRQLPRNPVIKNGELRRR